MENNDLIKILNMTVTPPALTDAHEVKPILVDINFTIRQGEWVTLLGRNGSGKSTLAKVVSGFRVAGLTGHIERQIDATSKGRTIPIVMQNPEASMVGATPWEDVVLMLEQNEAEATGIIHTAEQTLRKVGLGERKHQPIENLSGGQKQLAAIAGCLAVHAPMLILDEVTAMLDPEAACSVLEQVRALHQSGMTVLWITQKLEELESSDRIAVMDGGELIFDGDPDTWFARSHAGAEDSLCERLGFEAPYVAQVAWELEREGILLGRPFPFTAAMLAKAVSGYER